VHLHFSHSFFKHWVLGERTINLDSTAGEFAFAKRAVCLVAVVVDLVHQEVNQFATLAERSSAGLERHSHKVECLQHLGAFANSSMMGILAIQFLIQSVAGSLVICGAFEIFPHASALVHHGEFSCHSNKLHLDLEASGPLHCGALPHSSDSPWLLS